MSVVSSPACTPNKKSEKYKINSWLSKWMLNDSSDKDVVLDAAEIAAVLQAIGFKLVLLETGVPNNTEQKDEKNELSISVTCGKSGMHAVLTKQDYVCRCPDSHYPLKTHEEECNNEKNEICPNKNGESKHILPKLPKKALHLTREVLSFIFSHKDTIDINQNENEEFRTPTAMFPPTKQMNIFENESGLAKNPLLPSTWEFDAKTSPQTNPSSPLPKVKQNPALQSTWEVDPKTSPPTITSSPLPKAKKTEQRSQISDKEQILVDILQEAKKNIERALTCLPTRNNTFTKPVVKRVSNIPKSPRTPTAPKCSASFEIKSTIKRPGTPKKSWTPKRLGLRTPSSISTKVTPKLDTKLALPKPSSLRKNIIGSPMNKSKSKQGATTPKPTNVFATTPKTQSHNLKLTVSNVPRGPSNASSLGKPKSGIPSAFSKIPNLAYKKFSK